jgi:glycosyltransferase involved in cell wall biosynthesis
MAGTQPVTTVAPGAGSITVIVPTYNRGHYIEQCLDSLLAQSVPALEILVIDDGSQDDTAQRVARYAGQVTYIGKSNGGKPSAVNLGLQRARGEWIWIFDDDDVALPHANAQRLQALAAQPGAGFVYGAHLIGHEGPNGEVIPERQHTPPPPQPGSLFFELMRSCFWHLGTALVRRSLYLQLDGLDPALLSGEDYDFQIRLARVADAAYCAQPMFVFRQHEGVRGAQSIRYTAAERSRVFRHHSQAVGLKLRAAVPLGEYLVPPHGPMSSAEFAHESHAAALLNRMEVMGNHGCVNELLQDVETLLLLRAAAGQGLTHGDRNGMARAMRAGWAYEASVQEGPRFMAQAAVVRRQPGGPAALRALAAGVFALARSYPGSVRLRLAKVHHAGRLVLRSIL